jgi:hypothetical protein
VRAHWIVLARLVHELCLSSHLLTYLNLQKVVAANALVVHFMVSIVSIATALVLNEGETKSILRIRSRM